jgi:hypothetical protein
VEWDDQLHCLRNGSLHSFEGDPSLREGCPCGTGMTLGSSSSSTSTSSHLGVPPIVAADPNGRCAAALVYGRHLALLPAIQADVLEMLLQVFSDVGFNKLRQLSSVWQSCVQQAPLLLFLEVLEHLASHWPYLTWEGLHVLQCVSVPGNLLIVCACTAACRRVEQPKAAPLVHR